MSPPMNEPMTATQPGRRGAAPPCAPGRRERNKAEKRSRIAAAAAELLARHGYDRMTMAQVAREADVGIGTVFQYAATKPELLMMVTADRWAQVLPDVQARAARHLETGEVGDVRLRATDRILELLAPVADTTHREPELAMAIAREMLFAPAGEHRDRVLALVEGLERAVARVLVRAGARGAGVEIEAAARLVVSGAMVEANRSRSGRAPAGSMDDRLRALVTLVVAGAVSDPR